MEGKKFESTARTPPQSLPEPSAGYAVFRILCDVSQVGCMIGKSGRVIKQLRESTQSKIWVESGPPGSLYSEVTITAHVGSTLRVKLGVTVSTASNKEKGVQEQEVEVSRAQYALLIRVFEALNVGLRTSSTSTVSVMMLLEGSHVVTVIGKGGELLEMIWRETGCNLEIQTRDLPSFAKLGDVMMKIEGNVSAMKKALVSISSRMQACEPISIAPLRSRTMNVVPREDVLGRYFGTITQPRIDSLSQRSSDHRLVNSALKNHPVTIKHPLQASEDDIRNVVLKILCPQQSVSAVIKTLQSVRDASISVSDTLADSDERLITITASEVGRSGYRPPRSTSVRSPPPQTVKSAPPPATAQPNGGVGIFGSLGSTIADGVAWGTGNAFGHRIAESVFGRRTIKVETVASQAAAPASPVANSMSACDIQSNAFQDCVNNFGSDISKCQYYMDMLSECKKNSGSMISA